MSGWTWVATLVCVGYVGFITAMPQGDLSSIDPVSYYSDGGDSIIEISVSEAADYGLTCFQASELIEEAQVIVEEVHGSEGSAAAAAGASGASAAAASGGGGSSAAAAGGGGASSAAAGGVGSAAAAAAGGGDDSSAAAAAAGEGSAAAAAAAGGDQGAAGSAAAGEGTSAAAAAAGGSGSAAAAAAAAGGDVGSSSAAAAGGDSSSAAATAAGEGSASSAAAAGVGNAASAAAAGEGAASSAAAAGEGAASAAAAGGAGGSASSAAAGGGASSASAAGGGSASAAAGGSGGSSTSTGTGGDDPYGVDAGGDDHAGGETSQGCRCVPYYLCEEDEIITDGAGLIDIRFNTGESEESLANSECHNFMDVCCGAPLKKPNPDVIKDLIGDYTPTCGHRNPEGISVVIEGFKESESQFGEFPWMAIITEEETTDDGALIQRFVCGGSLIKPNVVLTAAHCVKGRTAGLLRVRLGEWDTKHDNEILRHEQHYVSSMVHHESFNSKTLFNDVALLFLEADATLQQHIDTICLPSVEDVYDDADCVATGFGKDKFHGGQYQNIMKQVDLEVVERGECQTRLRKTRLGRWFRLHESFTCAGGETGVDTCKGDGGSPLVCPRPEDSSKYVQVGIVAWGIGCGDNGVPGVYASIIKLVPWINQKLGEHLAGGAPNAADGY